MIIYVNDPNGISSAIASATDGDTIILDSNIEYRGFKVFGKNFGEDGISIKSSDENMVEIQGFSTIGYSSGISLENILFKTTEPEDYSYLAEADGSHWLLTLQEAENIKITGSRFEGHAVTRGFTFPSSDGYPEKYFEPEASDDGKHLHNGEEVFAGKGVQIRGSQNIDISDNSFGKIRFGIGFEVSSSSSRGVSISQNHFNEIREDAIRGTNHDSTNISENIFENFMPFEDNRELPSAGLHDHGDAIQFWGWGDGNGNSYGVSNFTIERNFIFDDTGITQAIFGHNGHLNDSQREGVFHENFFIRDNLIITGSTHGISLGSVDGGVVSGNTLLPNINALGSNLFPMLSFNSSERSWRNDSFDQIDFSKNLSIYGNFVGKDINKGSDDEGLFYLTNLNDDFEFADMGITDENGNSGADNFTYSIVSGDEDYLGDADMLPGLFEGETSYDDVRGIEGFPGSTLISVADVYQFLIGEMDEEPVQPAPPHSLLACIDIIDGEHIYLPPLSVTNTPFENVSPAIGVPMFWELPADLVD